MKPVPHGEPYAGNLHVRFDEGAGVPDNKGRSALLYTLLSSSRSGSDARCVVNGSIDMEGHGRWVLKAE